MLVAEIVEVSLFEETMLTPFAVVLCGRSPRHNMPGYVGQFSSPHSVAYHNRTNTFFIADRGNNRTQQFSAKFGSYLGSVCVVRPVG